MENSDKNKTHFGFKSVNKEEKSGLVKGIFSNVAKKYDLMNDFMSMGIHRIWKKRMVEEIFLSKKDHNYKMIDLAGGTGDIAFRVAKKASENNAKIDIEVVDINQEMLDVGKARAIDNNLYKNLNFVCCDGENLSFEDNSFDYFTIAFGIRNFTDIDLSLIHI